MKGAVIDSMVQTTQKSRIATKWAELGATTANTLAESNNIVVKLLNNAASALATFVTKQLAKAKGEETAAVIANTGAWLTNPIGWIAAVIAGIVAILALLVGGIVAVT
jgi:hypothetical protein